MPPGTKLQLPVYAYAARARLGEPSTPVEASYWFVRKGGRRIPVPLTAEVEARYVDTLDVIVSSIAAGLLPGEGAGDTGLPVGAVPLLQPGWHRAQRGTGPLGAQAARPGAGSPGSPDRSHGALRLQLEEVAADD